MRLLTFSTLYPHAGRPNHGIFVENRLRHLVATGRAASTVVAPVPWFPSKNKRFGDWSVNAHAERLERRNGLQVFHPRYAVLPGVGMSLAPAALFMSARRVLRRLIADGLEFDLIDGHYLYPDGVAAVALGRLFKRPVVLTARGSDITQYPEYVGPRRMIRWAMSRASALISVSGGLKQAMVRLGAPEQKVTVLRNGVDLEIFRPTDAEPVRRLWNVNGPVLLSVGHLIQRKGHHIAIRTLLDLPGWTLAIVGEGPERAALQRLAVELKLQERVVFCGAQPHSALPSFYAAADLLILASSREGWANVLLESMACGTPVIASNIPGNAEVVHDHAAGEVVAENSSACFAATIARFHSSAYSRAQTRAYAEGFGWGTTTQGQLDLFERVLRERQDGCNQNSLVARAESS